MTSDFETKARNLLERLFEDGANAQFRHKGFGNYADFENKKKYDVDETLANLTALFDAGVKAARREENQIPLDKINNFKPKPGQLTSANFGSAGGALETASWKHYFENRLAELSAQSEEEKS